MQALRTVWEAPAPPMLAEASPAGVLNQYANDGQSHLCASTTSTEMKASVERLITLTHDRAAALAATGAAVWVHGDATSQNMALTTDGVVLFDWEGSRVAPPEMDVAAYLHSVLVSQPLASVDAVAQQVLHEAEQVGVDPELVWALTGLAAAVAAARLLHHTPEPQMTQVCRIIDLAHTALARQSAV